MGSSTQDAKTASRKDRAARLSSALRENLRRRKAQARLRSQAAATQMMADEANQGSADTPGEEAN